MNIKDKEVTITMGELMEIMSLVRCANVLELQYEEGSVTDSTMFDLMMHAGRVEVISELKIKEMMNAKKN